MFEWAIAWSHLRSRRQDAGVSLIALLSVVGVTLGVMVLIIVLSVMAGFEIDLRNKILGNNAHLLVLSYDGAIAEPGSVIQKMGKVPGVLAAAPFVYTEVMIRSKYATAGAVLKGLDPALTPEVTDIERDIEQGPQGETKDAASKAEVIRLLHSPPPAVTQDTTDTEALPGILLGKELANQLKVLPGDKVHIINPVGGGIGPLGVPMPTARGLRVAGIFYTGMYEYDTKWSYVVNGDAQEFLGMGAQVSGIEARIEERLLYDVVDLGGEVEASLGYPYYTRNWLTMNAPLFSALKLEKYVMGLILNLIIVVAAVGIVTNLTVMVITRGREIAILRAMGASAASIRRVFILEGSIVGLVGTGLGTVLGLVGCALLDRYKFPLDTNVYYLDSLPVVVEPASVAAVVVGALVICFGATLYPANRAASIAPVEGLRYE